MYYWWPTADGYTFTEHLQMMNKDKNIAEGKEKRKEKNRRKGKRKSNAPFISIVSDESKEI